MRAFYDLRPDVPFEVAETDALQHEHQIDRERRAVERHFRLGNERAMHRALARMHLREERPER